MSVPKHWQLGG